MRSAGDVQHMHQHHSNFVKVVSEEVCRNAQRSDLEKLIIPQQIESNRIWTYIDMHEELETI